ncbi:MAG: type I DNA topoisomerase, partial [Erysipelotrichia bacterium]|nr:type I DNA topoisomerase [Erysipelotrichia bacterium]
MKLIIVESPTKCATIKRYLGDDYEVLASRGHVRDLATSGKGGLGVDVENDFKPTYVINKERAATVKELKRFAKKAEDIILATDPDREGEAIAWHLAQILELDLNTTKRLEFHEITRDSVTHAIANPKTIDLDLVSSQETRRILDRIIGFKLSSFLYKKIRSRSAGRVQSATLKIIADVDNEIKAFVPEEYWKILVDIDIHGTVMALDLKKINDEKVEIHNDAEASQILALVPDVMKVKKVKKEIKSRVAKPPFTTSTLQQAAYNKFGYKTSKTSIIAQKLYEGVAIKDGLVGLITYMRTDSTRLSETFINRAKNYITEAFGANYIGETKKSVNKRALAQDAHEAIRPT